MTINFFDLPIEAVTERVEDSSKQYAYKTIKVLDGNKLLVIDRDTMNYPSFHIDSWSPNMSYLIGEAYADDHDELFMSGHYLVYKVVEINDIELILEKMSIYRPISITYKDKYAVLNSIFPEFSWELINLETLHKKTIAVQKGWKSLKLDYIENYDLYIYDRYKYVNYIKTEVLNLRYKSGFWCKNVFCVI